jgi:hypothetical protein
MRWKKEADRFSIVQSAIYWGLTDRRVILGGSKTSGCHHLGLEEDCFINGQAKGHFKQGYSRFKLISKVSGTFLVLLVPGSVCKFPHGTPMVYLFRVCWETMQKRSTHPELLRDNCSGSDSIWLHSGQSGSTEMKKYVWGAHNSNHKIKVK